MADVVYAACGHVWEARPWHQCTGEHVCVEPEGHAPPHACHDCGHLMAYVHDDGMFELTERGRTNRQALTSRGRAPTSRGTGRA